MTSPDSIAIIGAGMAGLACARRLSDAGVSPVVLDKGRGIGGRIATRRGDGGYQFDHGAQFVTARSDGFAAVLAAAQEAGSISEWDLGTGKPVYVGTPGMTSLAKHLGRGLEIRQNTEVTQLREIANGWSVITDGGALDVEKLVVTAPAPQTAALLGPSNALGDELASVGFDPCLTLMAAFAPSEPWPYAHRIDPDDPLAWIALDSSKPGRPPTDCWVAQASPEWSRENLERDRAEIAKLMLPMLCERLEADPANVLHAAAHRWRYARVSRPLGTQFLCNEPGTLFAGGDWCLDARVEAAWLSGHAIAGAILKTTHMSRIART